MIHFQVGEMLTYYDEWNLQHFCGFKAIEDGNVGSMLSGVRSISVKSYYVFQMIFNKYVF